jgi:hypothetical protein
VTLELEEVELNKTEKIRLSIPLLKRLLPRFERFSQAFVTSTRKFVACDHNSETTDLIRVISAFVRKTHAEREMTSLSLLLSILGLMVDNDKCRHSP